MTTSACQNKIESDRLECNDIWKTSYSESVSQTLSITLDLYAYLLHGSYRDYASVPAKYKILYQEEEVDNNVEVKGRKLVTNIAVVPHEDLYWYHHGCVEQKHAADEKHSCNKRFIIISYS